MINNETFAWTTKHGTQFRASNACVNLALKQRPQKIKKMVKVAFITGISGQDGSYLAELLLEKEYIVWGDD